MIDGHGDDLHQYEGEVKYNFSSNVYYKGCSLLLYKELEANLNRIENYPSPAASELNVLAAQHFNLNENNFLFTNGATEAFYLIAQKYTGKSTTIIGPTFAEYEDACKINRVDYSFVSWSEIGGSFSNDLVFICNPNNPTGSVLNFDDIKGLLEGNPNTHFVIDEAYNEFTNTVESALPLIKEYENLTIVRSLTKTFAMPGLRLGYVVSNANFINELLRLKMPWSVNSLAIVSGMFIFNNYDLLSFNVSTLLKEVFLFKKAVNEIDYLSVVDGETTYFLVELKKGKASKLKKYLIEDHQILIRDATNFTGLEGEFIRLSVQSELANNTLLNALKQWS